MAEHAGQGAVRVIDDLVVAKNRQREWQTKAAASDPTADPRSGRFSGGRTAGGVRTSTARVGRGQQGRTRTGRDGGKCRTPIGERLGGLRQVPTPPSPPRDGKARATRLAAPTFAASAAVEGTSGVSWACKTAWAAPSAAAMSPAAAPTTAAPTTAEAKLDERQLRSTTSLLGEQEKEQLIVTSCLKEGDETGYGQGSVPAIPAEENSTQCPETESGDGGKNVLVGNGASVTPSETAIRPRVLEVTLSPQKTPTLRTDCSIGGSRGKRDEQDDVSGSIKRASGEIPLLGATAAIDDASRIEGVEDPRGHCVRGPTGPERRGGGRVAGLAEPSVSSVEVPERSGSRAAAMAKLGGGEEERVAPGAVTIESGKVWNARNNIRIHLL